MNSLQFLKLSTTHHMKHRNVAAVKARERTHFCIVHAYYYYEMFKKYCNLLVIDLCSQFNHNNIL